MELLNTISIVKGIISHCLSLKSIFNIGDPILYMLLWFGVLYQFPSDLPNIIM